MSFSTIINALDSYLKSGEKRKEALQSLLFNGEISQQTFELMEKKLSRLASIVSDLKATLEAEESFWKTKFSEENRILESILVEFNFRHLLGEIGEEEWTQKGKILDSGLNSLRSEETLTKKAKQEPAVPIQTTLEEHTSEKIRTESEMEDKREPSRTSSKNGKNVKQVEEVSIINDKHLLNRHKRRITKEPPDLESSLVSRTHCMNPWKPDCRNTDIELSIYYNGRMTPICSRCWEDISKKNIEWSSL